MAKVNPNEYLKERAARGGGDNKFPNFIRSLGKHHFACVDIAHTRSKTTGRWAVVFLMICVEPANACEVATFKCWTDNQVHGLIAGAYGYAEPYENGLPSGGEETWDKFDPKPELLSEMLGITTCRDQKKGGKGDDKAHWNPTISKEARRSVYVEIDIKATDRTTQRGDVITECGFANPIRERGEPGPYHVKNYRDAVTNAEAVAVAKAWFQGQCEKEVRAADEAARERAGKKGGGSTGGGGTGDSYVDDDVPF